MENSAEITGNQNIVIQNITDSTITICQNGEIKDIRNELISLKELLQDQQTKTFYSRNTLYQIDEFNENKFNYLTGKKAFNEYLTKEVTQALSSYNPAIEKFLEKANGVTHDWETQTRISDIAKDLISYSFVGVLGVQLRKLMAIGKEDFSTIKQRKYVENCILTARRILQLMVFALVSEFWNHQKSQKCTTSEGFLKTITSFFESGFELDIPTYRQMLEIFLSLYKQNKLDFIISEFTGPNSEQISDEDFVKACESMHQLNETLDRDRVTLLDCYKAELQLTKFLVTFNYLSAYKMVSIKNIAYDEMRNNPPYYLHRYTALGLDSKFNINFEKVNYVQEPISTDAILFFKEHYNRSINLFPFIIDINALSFENGSRICFYECRDITDGSLNYRFLEDNQSTNVVFKNTLKTVEEINELMMDVEKQKKLKFDKVFQQFQEAQSAFLGQESKADDFSPADVHE